MNKFNRILAKVINIFSLIMYTIFAIFLYKLNILPKKYRLGLLMVIGVILLINLYLIFVKKKKSSLIDISSIVLLVVLNLAMFTLISYANKSTKAIEEINNKKQVDISELSIVSLKDSKINNMDQAFAKELAIAGTFDKDNTNKALEEFKKKYKKEIKTKNLESYQQAAKAIIDKKSEVMLLNESYRPIIEESIEGFSEKTKVLDSTLVTGDDKRRSSTEDIKTDASFNIYISGIDTFGSLSTVSRSDVNMILSVNPVKKKILITTIPRDTYVSMGGEKDKHDKLTHAGLFGVETSIKSLEDLLDIKLDYYGKVNFTSLKELIDTLGGIWVDNPVSFETSNKVYYFPKGRIFMNGDKALAFSRERYNLEEGDFDRGKNQARVLTGIIRKSLSQEMLLNFDKISKIALESINTDIPYSKMIELVNKELERSGEWKIETLALKGEGTMELDSYLMPEANLYMMKASEESIKEIHDRIIENNKQ